MANNDDLTDFPLSDDPKENLRMENELLRLKLKAELGAESHNITDIDPEVENAFLKNVLAFEHNFAGSKPAKVFDLLGKPDFIRAIDLTDDLIEQALQQITDLLAENNMEVYFGDGYDSRTKYNFITEELFEHETTVISMPGMTTHFDYEEFHPNHKKDIENRTIDFLSQWFKRDVSEKSWELADQFILPDRRILGKADVVAKMKLIFDAYTAFTDEKYKIFDVGFQLDEEEGTGMGHAEGAAIYNAVLENGENMLVKGQFKFYLTLEHGWWSICHIIFPGFEY